MTTIKNIMVIGIIHRNFLPFSEGALVFSSSERKFGLMRILHSR